MIFMNSGTILKIASAALILATLLAFILFLVGIIAPLTFLAILGLGWITAFFIIPKIAKKLA